MADAQLQNFYALIDTTFTVCCSDNPDHAKEVATSSKGASAAQQKIKSSGMAVMAPMRIFKKQLQEGCHNQACNADFIGSAPSVNIQP
ncbi:hypothetical protein [Niabella hirudinis]|uniref:hypothetical protein n=1 Tax=Niabella hirudinis TaxID=1285929 RepID=UPI003EB8D9B1